MYGTFLPEPDYSLGKIEQCGADVPDYRERCGNLTSPPRCERHEACVTEDGCEYRCIKKTQCQENLFFPLMKNGEIVCNCAKEPTSRWFWACNFNDDKNGHATVPEIDRIYDFDHRKITILGGSRVSEYENLLYHDESIDGLFQTSPCRGTPNITDGSVTFTNVFNNEECMPSCETIESSYGVFEECRHRSRNIFRIFLIASFCEYSGENISWCEGRKAQFRTLIIRTKRGPCVVIGSDDLVIPLRETQAKAVIQQGRSWLLTCLRSLVGFGVGPSEPCVAFDYEVKVRDEPEIEAKFNLDIRCCDPDDIDCFDDCKHNPFFKVGPFDDPSDEHLLVTINFEDGSKNLQDRGFIHVESCTYEEFGKDNQVLVGPLEVIRDGCPTGLDDLFLLENLRERTLESSNREIMDLIPLMVDNGSLDFKLTCNVLKCPWDAVDNKLCKLEDQCFMSDRYAPFDSYTGTSEKPQIFETETLTRSLRHPCSEVKKEGDTFCVGDQETDCWTKELCENRSRLRVESPKSSATQTILSFIILVFML